MTHADTAFTRRRQAVVRLPVRSGAQDEEASLACVDFSMAELLRGERAHHYGLRVYMGLAFRSGRWLTRDRITRR